MGYKKIQPRCYGSLFCILVQTTRVVTLRGPICLRFSWSVKLSAFTFDCIYLRKQTKIPFSFHPKRLTYWTKTVPLKLKSRFMKKQVETTKPSEIPECLCCFFLTVFPIPRSTNLHILPFVQKENKLFPNRTFDPKTNTHENG